MEHTYEDLKKKNVKELREIAHGLESDELKGVDTLHKEHLLEAICKVLKIEAHVHHHVEGVDKSGIKQKIKAAKAQRDAALESRDKAQLKVALREIHKLKRTLRKATV